MNEPILREPMFGSPTDKKKEVRGKSLTPLERLLGRLKPALNPH